MHSAADPFAEAVLVADGQVAWLGPDDAAHRVADGADEVVDLDGALVDPGVRRRARPPEDRRDARRGATTSPA